MGQNAPILISATPGLSFVALALTFGEFVSFHLSVTDSLSERPAVPDVFSFTILEPSAIPKFSTSDPTGANALFTRDLGVDPALHVFDVHGATIDVDGQADIRILPIPEPTPTSLLLTAFAVFLLLRFARIGQVLRSIASRRSC